MTTIQKLYFTAVGMLTLLLIAALAYTIKRVIEEGL